MERNQGFENSLRCLGHPLSLVSISLLLLNDHVFKVISPSWLTGKLSDFAGLFFFPFIVAAGLSALLFKFNFKSRTIGQVSFSVVAIWFLLLKTSSYFNSLSSQFASPIVGYQTQFILDWTDLIGLTAMLPAWKLWNQNQPWRRNKFAYVILSVGIFASIATSPPLPTVETVTHLSIANDAVVAFDVKHQTMATSEDGGKNWTRSDGYSDKFPNEYVALPKVECWTDNESECYRIDGNKIVEISKNRGETWDVSWELPTDRITYLNRVNPDIDLGPYDLIIIPWEGRDYVLVAMGDEGILRKELPDGAWERIRVENAEPTPYKTTSISKAVSITFREILIWFLLSIIAFHISCWFVWSENSKNSPEPLSKAEWIFSPALSPIAGMFLTVFVIVLVFLIFFLLSEIFTLGRNVQNILLIFLIIYAAGALALTPGTIYLRLKRWKSLLTKNQYPSHVASALTWLVYLTHICVFLTGCVFWIFWAMDVISRYDLSLLIVLLSTCLVALLFFRKIGELSKQHSSESDLPEP